MNLADAIRQAAQYSSPNWTQGDPSSPEITVVENESYEVPMDPTPLGGTTIQMPEPPSTAILGGSVVRLELFLAPEQLNSLFKSIVATQHTVMTLREAANFLRIPSATLEQMAQERNVPAFQVDGKWRFSRVGLEDWLSARSAQQEKEA